MKLVLKNIGMLKSAEITLDRLTIIAGENDNGKSTVGKVVFCIIKAINRYKEDLQESKEHKIRESLNELFFALRRGSERFDEEVNTAFNELRVAVENLADNPAYVDEFKKRFEELKLVSGIGAGLRGDFLERFESRGKEIVEIALTPEDKKRSIESAFKKVFASEFDASVLYLGADSGSIKLYENTMTLLDLQVTRDNKFKLRGDVHPIELRDATFIESPLVLNNHDLLIRSQSGLSVSRERTWRLGLPYTTLHTKDLFDKLREPFLGFMDLNEEEAKLKHRLDAIVSGEIHYDESSKDFVYRKGEHEVSIKNTASGIKVFGLLQLLISNEFMNKNTVFIFDEPENHLHPKWQLKLAKVLVQLAQHGVFIIVSSHSPYMIEALQRYSEECKMSDSTHFYLAELQKIEDKDRLEAIFRILAEPFETFRRMDARKLKDE